MEAHRRIRLIATGVLILSAIITSPLLGSAAAEPSIPPLPHLPLTVSSGPDCHCILHGEVWTPWFGWDFTIG